MNACLVRGSAALYGSTSLLMRASPWMGASADSTADWNAASVATSESLRNRRKNVDVCLLPLGSSVDVRLPARADSRLLVRGPPLVSVPPIRSPMMEMASRTPDPTSVAHRYLKTSRPQP